MKSILLTAYSVVAILLLQACLVVSSHAAKPLMTAVADSEQQVAFQLPNIQGDSLTLADFNGKLTLVNFWAVWCFPCRKEMPSMQRAYQKLSDRGFEIVAIHVGPSKELVERFLKDDLKGESISFTVLIDSELELANWGVPGLPTSYLLDPTGRPIYKAVGERKWDSADMIRFLEKQLIDFKLAKPDNGGNPVN